MTVLLALAPIRSLASPEHPAAVEAQPAIRSLLKPEIYKKVIDEKEALAFADLQELPGEGPGEPLSRYEFYSAVLARANPKATRETLTNYALYKEIIPYVRTASFDPATNILEISGGIWKFMMTSRVRFTEVNPNWLKFELIWGHFKGLKGDIFLEPYADYGTLVYVRGSQTARKFPPAFVIEKGAEIVFTYTARKMRSYLETEKGMEADEGKKQIPQPRTHL